LQALYFKPLTQSIGPGLSTGLESAPKPTQPGNPAMSKKPKKHGPNKAKSIVAQPLFRCRQERPDKGKGSYRREAFQSRDWEASYFLAA
jgi:stalled ribosome alternative rescue factor ArfA